MTEKYKNVTIQVQQVRYFSDTVIVPVSVDASEVAKWLEYEWTPLEYLVERDADYEEYVEHDAIEVDNSTFPINEETIKQNCPSYANWYDEDGEWFDPNGQLEYLKEEEEIENKTSL